MTRNILVRFSKKFDKQHRKADPAIRLAFEERLGIFLKNPFDPLLNNHALTGKYKGFRSINVTGDWRAIYSESTNQELNKVATFHLLGTHSQLYK